MLRRASRVAFLRKQEPIATGVRGCERYLPLFSQEEPQSGDERIALTRGSRINARF